MSFATEGAAVYHVILQFGIAVSTFSTDLLSGCGTNQSVFTVDVLLFGPGYRRFASNLFCCQHRYVFKCLLEVVYVMISSDRPIDHCYYSFKIALNQEDLVQLTSFTSISFNHVLLYLRYLLKSCKYMQNNAL